MTAAKARREGEKRQKSELRRIESQKKKKAAKAASKEGKNI
jgi:hypothetical protein